MAHRSGAAAILVLVLSVSCAMVPDNYIKIGSPTRVQAGMDSPIADIRSAFAGIAVPLKDGHRPLSCPNGCWLGMTADITPAGQDATPAIYVIRIDNYLLDEIDVYLFDRDSPPGTATPLLHAAGGATRSTARGTAGVHLGFTTWDFPVHVAPGQYDLILRVRSPEAFIPVSVMGFDRYRAATARRELVFAGLYGAILAVTLAAAAVVLIRTDATKAILLHTGFQLSYVAYQLSRDGVLPSLFWPGNQWMLHRGYIFFTGLSLLFLELLLMDVLRLEAGYHDAGPGRIPGKNRGRAVNRARRLLWLGQLAIPAVFMAGIVMVPDAALPMWQKAGRLFLIASLAMQLVISGRAMLSGETYRKVRVAGIHIAVWGIIIGAAKATGILPYAYFQYYALAGMVLESILFVVSVYLRINHLALERSRLEAGLREANLALLQSRGRPHFLANTFAMIQSMMRGDPAASERAFGLLITDFRFFTDNASLPLVSLRDEMAYIDNYLAIMHLRFENGLVVDRTVPDSLPESLIPPLSLQPLVENAIHHAAPPDGNEARWLALSLVADDRYAVFRVDNRCTLADSPAIGFGTTHMNILARMRYYHPDSALTLSASGGLFSAVLRWPTGGNE